MKKLLSGVMLAVFCLTAVLSPAQIPFSQGDVSKVEAAIEKQFNKSSKIYASRSRKAKVILNVQKNQAVTVLETVGSWSKVRVGKKTGWTANRDLSVVKPKSEIDRPSPTALFEKVKLDPRFAEFEGIRLIGYKYEKGEQNFLQVFHLEDKGIIAMRHWFGDAYKPGVRPKEREAMMKYQYESIQMMGELMYGPGTQEAKNYASVASAHMTEVERLVMEDWHNRMRYFKEGTFRANGDSYKYYMAGPGIEIEFSE
ncbi:SH3 domain-containing protein [Exiguobacterium sp. MMG028]|uniref:SH3 domain-containing protein n=1 Tax=Exiguobacterium sp. MMG028 TaxID=3021979 RepID=UPI0022FE67E6|nr:SH3 domain-containing protein [Exiguobacterium sp. MMG028]MDA5560814.1 SH3 domain-containing protein [Exiguobacterium sp. MMG028]